MKLFAHQANFYNQLSIKRMPSLIAFNNQDLERLYLTYKRNTTNYKKIKNKVIGDDAIEQYKRNRKSSIFFFIAVTFIIIVSSSFSLMASHMDSFIALWMIWGIAFTLFSGWSFFNYKTTYRVLQQNQDFFDKFENIAQKSPTLEDFAIDWHT